MREILFRGKRIDNDEWVEGYLCKSVVHNETFHQNVVVDTIEAYDGKSYLNIVFRNVHKNSIGQFTGLTDKNGKKIFEGDIVRDEYNGGIAWIAFLQQGCGWYLVFKNTDRRMGHRSRNSAYDNDLELEVIGNIHDNPELLGGSEDAQ